MSRSTPSRSIRLFRTILVFVPIVLLQWLAQSYVEPQSYLLFYPAVIFAALFGSAPLAIVLSLIAVELAFVGEIRFTRILIFTGSGFLVSHITEKIRASRRMALDAFAKQEAARVNAERTVALLDAVFASAPFGLGFLDKDLRYVRVNDSLARWNGFPIDFHIGKSVQEIVGDSASMLIEKLRVVLKDGVPINGIEFDYFPSFDPGRLHNYLIGYYPVRTAVGEVIGVGAMVLDVTAQKESEIELRQQNERLDLAIRAGEIGVWELNRQTRHFKWTDRQYKIFGMDPREPVTWERFAERIHPEDLEATVKKIEDAFKSEIDSHLQFDYRILRPDGQLRWLQSNSQLLKVGDGKRLMAGTSIDITERKKAEVLREQFVSTLSHDLRTPLTAARMAAQMVSRSAADSDLVKINAAKVIKGLDRADRMIRDLLDVSRIRVGRRLPVQRVAAELGSVIKSTVDELSVIYGDRFRVFEKSPILGSWDVGGLRRLVENLCSNAVKYGEPNGKVSIYIDEVGSDAEIRVHNFGEPIAKQNRDKVFDYLHRVSGAQVSSKTGWGIGLTVVRGVTEAHGGRVSLQSEAGDGTTFIVTLPKMAKTT